jgi:murein DD-endopeptidase MepM/ murein hydrolase activator NlpD
MTGGIVVSVENEWYPQSKLRGGKYIWIYDISSEALVYYAHNKEIFVRVGDIVSPGDIIAKVGRTGLNAYKKRSPTHLHLTYLRVRDGYPKPENIFSDLKNALTASPHRPPP